MLDSGPLCGLGLHWVSGQLVEREIFDDGADYDNAPYELTDHVAHIW
jgi:hypothetical protein